MGGPAFAVVLSDELGGAYTQGQAFPVPLKAAATCAEQPTRTEIEEKDAIEASSSAS